MAFGSLKPIRSGTETYQLISMWDIGASGAHTKTSGVSGEGFASVARTAAGKYTITFSLGATTPGRLIDLEITHWPAVDAASLDVQPRTATWTAESGSTGASVKYEAWDNDTTAQTELASGDQVTIKATFLKTK